METRTHHTLRRVAVALAAAALFAPAATAADGDNALLRNDIGHFGSQTTQATTSTPTRQTSPSAPVVVVRVDDAFDWVAAVVGAAAGGGVLLLVGGGASALRNRRRTLAAPFGGR